jgi:hypothetical protein
VNGNAAATGLNAMATPHNPAPTAAVMLTRFKIVIDVDPFHISAAAEAACRTKAAGETTALIISRQLSTAHHAAPQRVQKVTRSAWAGSRQSLDDNAIGYATVAGGRRGCHQGLVRYAPSRCEVSFPSVRACLC